MNAATCWSIRLAPGALFAVILGVFQRSALSPSPVFFALVGLMVAWILVFPYRWGPPLIVPVVWTVVGFATGATDSYCAVPASGDALIQSAFLQNCATPPIGHIWLDGLLFFLVGIATLLGRIAWIAWRTKPAVLKG